MPATRRRTATKLLRLRSGERDAARAILLSRDEEQGRELQYDAPSSARPSHESLSIEVID